MITVVKTEVGFNDKEFLVEDACYFDCGFNGVVAEGAILSGSVFVSCRFANTDLYWCQAFRARFVDCMFKECDLRGNFDESVFVRCRFENCQYGRDNLGGNTEWEQAIAIECSIDGTPLPIVDIRSE